MVEVVADTPFVRAEIAFAGIRDMASGFAFGDDKIHKVSELFVGQ